MSPSIVRNEKIIEKSFNDNEFNKIKEDLVKIRKFVENNFEFVGNKFSKEVREIYYENKKSKNIFGTATKEEKSELEEEGIDLLSIPWIDNKEN